MKKKGLFICSPGLGLMDNWMPVIYELNKSKKYSFDIFFPNISVFEQFNKKNLLVNFSYRVFKNVIYVDIFNNLIKSKFSKKLVQKLSLNKYFRFIDNLLVKFFNKEALFSGVILKNLHYFTCLFFKTHKLEKINQNNLKKYDFVFYDVYVEDKSFFYLIKKELNNIEKFSMSHGDFPYLSEYKTKKIPVNKINIIAFTHSRLESEYYKKKYKLEGSYEVMGNPKYDKSWVNKIRKEEKLSNNYFSKYVLLISRNSSPYLPIKRKIEYLKIIKKNIINKDIKLVIKLHPKEDVINGRNLYLKIFGENDLGVKYDFTSDHLFQLSKNCIFSITFYSGMSYDFGVYKIPNIEILNLQHLPKKSFPNENIFFDKKNKPVFRIRNLGIVLGSDNEKDFNTNVKNILTNRKKVVKKLQIKLRYVYPCEEKSIFKIKTFIEDKLK
jgi:hypothetical protein